MNSKLSPEDRAAAQANFVNPNVDAVEAPKPVAVGSTATNTVLNMQGYRDVTDMLPSQGKAYPKGARILTRPFNSAELFDVSDHEERGSGGIQNYERVLTGIKFIVDGKELESHYLTIQDFLYVSFYRKVVTMGTKEFLVGGMSKGRKIQKKLGIEELEFQDMKAPAVPIRTKISGHDVSFRPPSVGAYLDWCRETKDIPGPLDMLILGCDVADPDIIRNSTEASDIRTLKKVDDYLDHGIKPIVIELEGGDSVMLDVVDPSNIILPFRGADDDQENEIHFG